MEPPQLSSRIVFSHGEDAGGSGGGSSHSSNSSGSSDDNQKRLRFIHRQLKDETDKLIEQTTDLVLKASFATEPSIGEIAVDCVSRAQTVTGEELKQNQGQ